MRPEVLRFRAPVPDDATVSFLLSDDLRAWSGETVRAVFDEEVANAVLQIPISRRGGSDFLSWPLTKFGDYSVRVLVHLDTPEPSPPLTGPVEPKATAAIDALPEDHLRDILRRLSAADLLRAALACHRWRRLASRCCARAPPPLLGYFAHPMETERSHDDAVFVPLDASVPRLSLDFAPDASDFQVYDSHQGLLLLQPDVGLPKGILPRFLVLDPATRRRALLPPPPRGTVPDDRIWRKSRHYVGFALLSRAHPSKLCFEAICFAIDEGHPRAWVASVDDGHCSWRALPRDEDIVVDFHPWWFEGRCVHAAGKIYWHICNSTDRILSLDPSTLQFSYLPVPAEVGWSDKGWDLERNIVDMRLLCDMIPGLPSDPTIRTLNVWPSDMDPGRSGKVFINTLGNGRYSFHPGTGKLERLSTESGKDYGHPIFAYFLAWPPAFLAPEY
ncbi:hypothetical protein ACQ4PT_008665 [Festuca glaucescens]